MYVLIQDCLDRSFPLPIYRLLDTNTGTATNWCGSLDQVLSLPFIRNTSLATELKYSPEYTIIAESTTPITKETYPELFI